MSAASAERVAAQVARSLIPVCGRGVGVRGVDVESEGGLGGQFHGFEVEVEFADGGVAQPLATAAVERDVLGCPLPAGGINTVLELTKGGATKVLEAVGHLPAYEQAVGILRPGGVISRVGVPQYDQGPIGWSVFGKNATLTGGPAPVRAYIEQLLPAILDGSVNPGKVFDRIVSMEETPQAYAAMDAREALKVMIKPVRVSVDPNVRWQGAARASYRAYSARAATPPAGVRAAEIPGEPFLTGH